jgi:hypothetical protein
VLRCGLRGGRVHQSHQGPGVTIAE